MITYGSLYALVPWMWNQKTMWSPRLVEWHFWLALSGTLVYVFSMWNSGVIQGLMWRTYTENGALAYSFLDSLVAMYPYYIARTFGGLLFLIGATLAAYNVFMTIRQSRLEGVALAQEHDQPAIPHGGAVQPGE